MTKPTTGWTPDDASVVLDALNLLSDIARALEEQDMSERLRSGVYRALADQLTFADSDEIAAALADVDLQAALSALLADVQRVEQRSGPPLPWPPPPRPGGPSPSAASTQASRAEGQAAQFPAGSGCRPQPEAMLFRFATKRAACSAPRSPPPRQGEQVYPLDLDHGKFVGSAPDAHVGGQDGPAVAAASRRNSVSARASSASP